MADFEKQCVSCKLTLTFAGVREFRTGGSGGIATFLLGQWAEASEDLLPLALYACTTCGRVELFLPPKEA